MRDRGKHNKLHQQVYPLSTVDQAGIIEMKFLLYGLAVFAFLVSSHAISIRTQVFAAKTSGDQGPPFVEMVTTVKESGNGQGESKTEKATLAVNGNFPGLGSKIFDRTFSGSKLPTTMSVRVTEDDGPTSKDDGVCNIVLTAKFSTTPTIFKCTRENADGLSITDVINVKIWQV